MFMCLHFLVASWNFAGALFSRAIETGGNHDLPHYAKSDSISA